MKHLNLGFIGFGLIGGSIARVLKKKNVDISITVYSRRKNPDLEQGVAEGVIDQLVYEIDETFSHCDIIFLCAPVLKNLDFLPVLKDIISPTCIITDVGSVKNNICQEASFLGLARQFIGGHPMAFRKNRLCQFYGYITGKRLLSVDTITRKSKRRH